MNRQSEQERKTKESNIKVSLNLDGSGIAKIDTGIGFFDHMLNHIAVHGVFDIELKASGDLHVDTHHTIEDVGIVLGKAFKQAIGDKVGIKRIGYSYVPMDEALALVVVDFSNRPYSIIDIPWTGKYFGKDQDQLIPLTLIEHFLQTFAINAGITLHVKVLSGKDDHHIAESVFKALGYSLDKASRLDPKRKGVLPSTKGTL
ncbi:MAG: imidazoleglycerol-phosphate dehydratase HisB [Candidatus Lokiarchaeota archaeon]|jgi:imidazoleglycerol-phosphate dehydratase|nr:imidazoleglycerol-phosphate dehydratase HisB [Candidatus Lokiarchaeota archaeon]